MPVRPPTPSPVEVQKGLVLERLLTAAEFGQATNTSERFARRLIDERRIRFVKLGAKVRIPESAVAEFISDGTIEAVR